MPQFRFFLDTSALFAGIWSAKGGGRLLLRLGEAGHVQLLLSSAVLQELETAFARKAPALLPQVALLLHLARVQVVPEPDPDVVQQVMVWLPHPGDARVLAAALASRPDFFVTLDRQHFLHNPQLTTSRVPFPIGTPGDALQWWRARILSAD